MAAQLQYEGKDVSQVLSTPSGERTLQLQVLSSTAIKDAIARQNQMDEIINESRRTGAKRAEARRNGDSMFISSLNGAEDDDGRHREAPERRNRPGQRARRAMAEKRFGDKCKHLKKETKKKEDESLHPSWAAKRRQKEAESSRLNCTKIKF